MYGGMNHFIYSRPFGDEKNSKFGNVSIKHMLGLMYGKGSLARNLRAHIIGGGHSGHMNPAVGEANIEIAERILAAEGIRVVTNDTGGQTGRKVVFNNCSGEIIIYKGSNMRKGGGYDGEYNQNKSADNR